MFDRRKTDAYQHFLPLSEPICLLCHQPSSSQQPLCLDCLPDLPWQHNACERCAAPLPTSPLSSNSTSKVCGDCLRNPPPWHYCTAPFTYSYPIDQLINRFKHHSDLTSGRLLGELLSHALYHKESYRPDLLIPVPLHWRRQLKRGFNQSLELARIISNRLDIPLKHQLIRKSRHTAPQHDLPREQRQRNLKDAFVVTAPVSGLHVALVDDVITTGSTVNTISKLLLKAGARSVSVWCIAKTPKAVD